MSKFYTHVTSRGNKVYLRGYENGERVERIVHYKPYLFVPKKDGFYRTLDGKSVDKIEFDSINEAKDFVERYGDVDNFEYYGLTNWPYLFIYDNYRGEIDYDPSLINVVTIDIEVAADEGFPSIEDADKEITAIALRCRGKTFVLGCGDFVPPDESVNYLRCKDEYNLIDKFIKVWGILKPDVITGWNTEFFDVPYLINRIRRLFGEDEIKKLSPWGMVNKREIIRGKSVARGGRGIDERKDVVYEIVGISSLDYLELYKKFSFSNQESYKLDYIAQVELGEKKVDYSEYGSLLELYKKDFQKFIEYNIHDCALVDRLNEKLGLIEQVMALAYDAKVNYNDTMTTVRPWDIIIHNYLLDQRVVIPQFKPSREDFELVGGYVKDPRLGMSKWVVSFDLNSLYPHLIMQYNISPETLVARLSNPPTIDEIIDRKFDARPDGSSEDVGFCFAANGCTYRKTKQGFLPALMQKMYDDRADYKKKMLEAKKSYEKTKSREDSNDIARYHNMQMAKKIQLNSAYGALGNRYFRWFSFDNAEAITMSGQLAIRWIERRMNEFMNRMLKTKDVDYVIASDTDSIYMTFEALVDRLGIEDDLKIVDALDKFVEAKIQPYMDESYQELADYMNAYQQKMKMKRETIANKGIWKAKKMYILNAWNVEGVQYEKPKMKIQGIEAVRSSTPYACRENIKRALEIIMDGDQTKLQEFIREFQSKFIDMPFDQIAFPRGMKGIEKYRSASDIYMKGTPIHVKGALLFNHLLSRHNIKTIPPIKNGDKVKFAYLRMPNPINDHVISVAEYLPTQFKLDDYVDRDMQFSKSFMEPLQSITEVIGWNIDNRQTLEEFFG